MINLCCTSKKKCGHYYNIYFFTNKIHINCNKYQLILFRKVFTEYNDKIFIFHGSDLINLKKDNLNILTNIKHMEIISDEYFDFSNIINYLSNLNSLYITQSKMIDNFIIHLPNLHKFECKYLQQNYFDYIFSHTYIYELKYDYVIMNINYTDNYIQQKLNENRKKLQTKYIDNLKKTKLSSDICSYIVNNFLFEKKLIN